MDINIGGGSFLDKVILGNTVIKYFAAAGMFTAGMFILWLLNKYVVKRLEVMAAKTDTKLDDFVVTLVENIITPLLYVGTFFLALNTLKIDDTARFVINKIGIVILTYFAIQTAVSLINFIVNEILTKNDRDETRVKSVKGLMVLVKGLVWLVGIILLLDNMGYKVSTIVAGLGIGGIAVALAAQAVLGDLFSYISIVFDKPFQPGDFIVVDNHMGTVENIGIKTTRIRSVDGEEIIFSNSNLTNSRVKNYKRMISRRVVLTLGVTYDTPLEKLKKIPDIIKTIIASEKDVNFDRAHFNNFGGSSLDFEVVYIVDGNDYNRYMDIKQSINFKIAEEFQKLKVDFAFPTQTLYINK